MNYTHPKKYKGLRIDTTNNQLIMKAYVEANCLRCEKFCGQEHDFSECVLSSRQDTTCPPECRKAVPYVNPKIFIKLPSEE